MMARLRKSRKFAGGAGASCCAGESFFAVDPASLFGRPAPLEIEIGSGKGDFIIERARELPQHNFLAIELGGSVFAWLSAKIARSGLDNLIALRADARPIVNLMLPRAGVREFHIYFPDPWPKNRHSKHRLFSAAFAAGLARCLEPQGRACIATDVGWYFDHIAGVLAQTGFALSAPAAPGALRTGFGRRFAAAGLPIHGGCFDGPRLTVRRDSPLVAVDV